MIKNLLKNRLAVFGGVVIAALAAIAIFAPLAAPHDPTEIDLSRALNAPSAEHPLGTDALGRDVASRIVYGSRVSLSIGFIAVGISCSIGIILGAAAGYYGGWVDAGITRFIDVMLCFPVYFLILAIIAILGPSIFNIMAIIGFTSWMGIARLLRAEILSLKERDFIHAARILGASDVWIIVRHLIPNAIGPVTVSATLGIGGAILTESALSFLGIGVQPPDPSWGNMLKEGMATLGVAWWLMVFPGVIIFITVLSYNLLGEGLRDLLEPRLRGANTR
ncbi:MAG: ABC transporter permease [Candidatus Omnitrophota bacterium]